MCMKKCVITYDSYLLGLKLNYIYCANVLLLQSRCGISLFIRSHYMHEKVCDS